MSQADVLKAAEDLVRRVLLKDLKQSPDEETVKAVAKMVANAVPKKQAA